MLPLGKASPTMSEGRDCLPNQYAFVLGTQLYRTGPLMKFHTLPTTPSALLPVSATRVQYILRIHSRAVRIDR